MRRTIWLLTLLIIAILITCAPIGSVYDSSGTTAHDDLWAVPYRMVYNINNLFRRQNDLSVFTSYQGALQPISIDKVNISVIENPDNPDEQILVHPDEDYQLTAIGRKIIVVSYDGLTTRYSIEVMDPLGITDSDKGSSSGGLDVVWVY